MSEDDEGTHYMSDGVNEADQEAALGRPLRAPSVVTHVPSCPVAEHTPAEPAHLCDCFCTCPAPNAPSAPPRPTHDGPCVMSLDGDGEALGYCVTCFQDMPR